MRRFLLSLAGAVVILTPLAAAPVLAGSATLSLSPSSTSVSQGSYLSVAIREASGSQSVNAVQANLSYPANLLSYVSISSSSAFSVVAQNSGGGGSVKVARGALPSVTGTQTVATVTFKALTSSGMASITFAGGSAVTAGDGSGTNVLAGTSGGNYTLKAAPPPAVVAPKDTTPPTITAVKVGTVSFKSAVITWTTSEPATSVVNYGVSQSYNLSSTDGNLVTAHSVTLNSALIVPAQLYHFQVQSADAAGNNASSPDATFTTVGAQVPITVVDQNKKPVAGVKVSIADSSAVTDKNGKATVTGVALGKQTIVVDYKGHIYTKVITLTQLNAQGAAAAVSLPIKVTSNVAVPIIIVLLVLAVLGGAWWFWKRGGGNLPPSIKKYLSAIRPPGSPPASSTSPPSKSSKTSKASSSSTQASPTVIKPTIETSDS